MNSGAGAGRARGASKAAVARRAGLLPARAEAADAVNVVAPPASSKPEAASSQSPATTVANLEAVLGLPSEAERQTQEAERLAAAAAAPAAPAATPTFQASSVPNPVTAGAAEAPAEGEGFFGVMGFAGPAPEVINGRAAMLGVLAAIGGELTTGKTVVGQLMAGGAAPMGAIFVAVALASFAPMITGSSANAAFNKEKEAKALGPFTAQAEMLNGRAAMMGFAALLALEATSGMPFFS